MRFHANGPSIPDDLLVARDDGRVIFFCGAGVSRARAGLSDFFGLAEKVTDSLGVTADDPVRKLITEARELDKRTGISGLISADRVFGLLERDFLVREIEASVADALKPKADVDLSAHRIMLDLARSPEGKTRLVTTNFDLLFETCDSSLPYFRPPRLPDPMRSEEFEGVIHLHGHVDKEYRGASGDGFVLSSSEFGNAYLADGWATQFIRSILDKFIVVFVGYAADDPPVLYLLEALNKHQKSLSSMYAFQAGSQSDAEAKWRHKGVLPIAYDETDGHRSLWDTLGAWACRAQNPELWHGNVIDMARKGPEALLPHERGQVAHIVSTLEGAKRVTASENPLPAEWLCVFDPAIRYLKPGNLGSYFERGPYFDPFESYGLDGDPIPPKIDPEDHWAKREIPEGVWNCFAATRLDRQNFQDSNFAALRGHYSVNMPTLPNRLWQLGLWISVVSYQPASVWWASHQAGLHSGIQARILYELERRKQESFPAVRRAWRYVFEAWGTCKEDYHEWYQLKAAIDLDGWSDAAVREVASIWRPYLKLEWPYSGGPKPPENIDGISVRQMISLDVKYPELHEKVEIPDEHLVTAVREFRKNLEHAVSLEKELEGFSYLTLCPIEPDPDLEGESSDRHYGISHTFLFYVNLFKRLIIQNPELAKQEYLAWWTDDDKVFARLRIWASGRQELLTGAETGQLLCSLNDGVFWDSHHKRDLMLTLGQRWSDFPESMRKRMEKRLLRGYSRLKGEDKKEYEKWRAWSSLNRIHWLHKNGCGFSFDLQTESAKLQKFAPEWQQQYAAKAAASMESRGGTVRTDSEFSVLLAEPLYSLLGKARELSGRMTEGFVEKDPFAGLASERPIRAFSALNISAKKGEWPEWAWRKFLYSPAREKDKPRFSALIAQRLANLSTDAVAGFIYPTADWLQKSSKALINSYPEQFEGIWSKIVEVLRTASEISKTGLVRGDKDPAWATEALNSPVGKLAQAIMNDPQKEGLKAGKGFPIPWTTHVEELLGLPGDHRRYALVMFAFHLNWFYAIAPAWTDKNILSALGNEDEDHDAFWDGFLWAATVPNEKLYLRLKPRFIKLALDKHVVGRREGNVLSAILLAGWGSPYKKTGKRFITNEEMRTVLLNADDDFRGQVIWQLERWSSEGGKGSWRANLPVFFTEVWPRQKQAKSPSISAKLCDLAFSNEAVFPIVTDTILPLVTRIDEEGIFLPHIRGAKNEIVTKYPEKTLALIWAVLPENATKWPYGIEDVLTKIGEAEPSLLNDSRLIELKRRWNAR
ncbi:MAG: hypothetical protein FD174_443 [Geobacteraceae bacterium]|nr:MAG: hypothetical protein FD174_443 [Geobacteraceae bacterium]